VGPGERGCCWLGREFWWSRQLDSKEFDSVRGELTRAEGQRHRQWPKSAGRLPSKVREEAGGHFGCCDYFQNSI
jgi:hypothetical protein